MRIITRLTLGFGLTVLLTVFIGSFALNRMAKLADITEQICQHPLIVSNEVRDIRTNIIAMHRSMKDVALAETIIQIKKASDIVDDYEKRTYESFDVVYRFFLGDMSDVEKAHKAFVDWKVIRDEVIKLSIEGQKKEAADITRGIGAEHVVLLSDNINTMINFTALKAISFRNESIEIRDRIFFTVIGLMLSMLILGLFGSITITRSIIIPLNVIVKKIQTLSKGFLHQEIEIKSQDELGSLDESFRELQRDLLLKTQLLDMVSKGNLSIDIFPRSENDELGKSFFNMIQSLRNARNDLTSSEQRYRNLTETVPVGISISTESGKIIEANHFICRIFGFETKEEFINYNAVDLYFNQEDRKRFIELHKKGMVKELELKVKRIDGSLFWGSMTSVSQKSEKYGTIYINSFVDISERKKIENELLEAKIEAESANLAKSLFLANMSHELRTPLNVIVGFSQVLELDKESFNLQQKKNIAYIRKSGNHLLEMVNDILDISKIEAGKLDIEKSHFNLNKLVTNVLSTVKPLADRKGLILRNENNTETGIIKADETRIKQILFNLLSNAIKFTHHGEVGININRDNKKIIIEVWDEGIGISEEVMENIFNPFVQAGEMYRGKSEGTGLGLAITKKLVEAHNGTITIESKLNKGSRVSIIFPGMTGEQGNARPGK